MAILPAWAGEMANCSLLVCWLLLAAAGCAIGMAATSQSVAAARQVQNRDGFLMSDRLSVGLIEALILPVQWGETSTQESSVAREAESALKHVAARRFLFRVY